jgi:hypothetical protein
MIEGVEQAARLAHEVDQDQPAGLPQERQVAREIIGANEVLDHLDAAAAGKSEDLLDEVMGPVVDAVVSAKRAAAIDLLGRAGGEEDGGAHVLGHLDRGGADAAAAGVDQDRFPALKITKPEDGLVRSGKNLDHGGRLDEAPGTRHGQSKPLIEQRVLGIGARGDQAEHALAGREARHA